MSGFVFFPAGEYTAVRAVLVEKTTRHVKEVAGPMLPPDDHRS